MTDDTHAAARLDAIRQLDQREQTSLICYTCGPDTEMERNDLLSIVELLKPIPKGSPVDLLLHCGGGDVDACEKMVSYIHSHVGFDNFRVIVPDMAKSAGTLMALSGSKILMGDTAELGMIDPQVWLRDSHGSEFCLSVMAYLEAFESRQAQLRQDPKDPVAILMLDGFDPKLVQKYQNIRDRVRIFAEDMLKRSGSAASTISQQLLAIGRWHTHGQPITYGSARQIGLPVVYLPNDQNMPYWDLYRLQRRLLKDGQKLFESAHYSEIVGPD